MAVTGNVAIIRCALELRKLTRVLRITSLQATWIRNSLLHALRETTTVDTRTIPINFVYNHSSISVLAEYMSSLATSNSMAGADLDGSAAVQAMHDMLEKYSHDFPIHSPRTKANGHPSRDTILVTGTTGGLGSTLLAQLVAMPEVEKVYAMNRKGDVSVKERQREILLDRGYDAEGVMNSSKVTFVEVEVEKEDLGLTHDAYEKVRVLWASITARLIDTSDRSEILSPISSTTVRLITLPWSFMY